jgi:hypothetical protein
MGKQIGPETSINLLILAAILAAIFSAYKVFAPELTQISVNKDQLRNHHEILRDLRRYQVTTNLHLLKISNSVSRIEGKLDD